MAKMKVELVRNRQIRDHATIEIEVPSGTIALVDKIKRGWARREAAREAGTGDEWEFMTTDTERKFLFSQSAFQVAPTVPESSWVDPSVDAQYEIIDLITGHETPDS